MKARIVFFSLPLIVLLGGGCAPVAVSQSDLDTPEYHFRLGARSLDGGEYGTALSAFQRSVDLDKKFAPGWGGLGLAQALTGDVENGQRSVDKAVSLDGKNPVTRVFRGRYRTVVKSGKNWLDKAEKDFEAALKNDPGNEAANFYLGEAYLNAYRFSQAEGQFAKVVDSKGELAGRANERWAVAQKIVRARPGTDAGRKIAIKDHVSRADLAVLFAEELKLKQLFERAAIGQQSAGFQSPAEFSVTAAEASVPPDVRGSWAEPWIKEALELGILQLDPSGNFLPKENVTRMEYSMAVQAILIAATHDASLATRYIGETPARFSDVSSSHFAYNAMALCTERGIIKPDMMTGKFDPAGAISGADALLIVREIQSSLQITF